MTGSSRRIILWLPALLAMCVLITSVQAADRRQRYPIQNFRVLDTSGEVYVRSHLQTKDETTQGSTPNKESDSFFEEGVELRAKGYIYHPNLVDWNASVRLGLTQQEIDSNGDARKSDGTLLGYNLSGLILKEKQLSARVYSSLSDSMVDRDFATTQELSTMRNGVEFLWRGGIPMRLLLEEFRLNEVGDDRENEQVTRTLRFTVADQRDPDRWWEIIYEHEDTDETTTFTRSGDSSTTEFPVQRDEVQGSARWRFGSGPKKHRLGVRGRWMDRKGFFINKVMEGDVSLDLAHSETFGTFYRAAYNVNETETSEDRQITGEVGFTKRFYESLDMTGRVITEDRQFLEGYQRTIGYWLDMLYNKHTPIGIYQATVQLGYEQEEEDNGQGRRTIRDENVTLSGTTYEALSEPNVIEGSITVTNLARTETYTEDDDFMLRKTGAFTEIARLESGDIADGETVLVTYSIETAQQTEFTTTTIQWNNRLILRKIPVELYYNYRLRDQQLSGGEDPGNLDTRTVQLFGIEVTLWEELVMRAEHEIREQLLSPSSTADRFVADYRRRLSRDVDLNLGGLIERLVYDDAAQFGLEPEDDHLNTLRGYARLTARVRRDMLVRFSADYVKMEGRENDEILTLVGSLDWNFRQIELSVEARQRFYTQELTTGTDQSLMVFIRRRF